MNDYYLINGRSSIYSVQRACRATSKTMTFATCRLFVDVVVVGGVTTDLKGRGRKRGGDLLLLLRHVRLTSRPPAFNSTSTQRQKHFLRLLFIFETSFRN